MGKPAGPYSPASRPCGGRGHRAKQNLLVARGKEINRDAPSSGERKGLSPNRGGVMAAALATAGLWDLSGGVRRLLGELQNPSLAEVPWNGAP